MLVQGFSNVVGKLGAEVQQFTDHAGNRPSGHLVPAEPLNKFLHSA